MKMLYIGSLDADEMKKVRRAIKERGLSSHMNDTKWRALCTAIAEELPFPPPYQIKLVLSDVADPQVFEAAPWYNGDWATTPEASMGIFIEWLKVAPRLSVQVGRLLLSRIEDCSDAFRNMLKRLGIPFQERDGFFTIYGHTSCADILPSNNDS
ncbi:DUF6678 family protein [Shinella sp.]|uniref:DUF6678 family protein n=1 Tax=Shinella sp. TaxID=1870904 RepID=UPI003F715933